MTNIAKTKAGWYSKFKAFGPGILMASAAIGGSHIVASTQAGALYGWQLAIIVILVNIFKYPFFRFGTQYTLERKKSLIEGYEEKGKIYLWVFFIMNIFSAIINIAAVGILTAAILANILKLTILPSLTPAAMASMINMLTTIVLVGSLAMMIFGGYKLLDSSSKFIVVSLTIATVVAVIIALFKHHPMAPNFVAPSPWKLKALPFIISLMGWMPAPIEISAINSMWTVEKQHEMKVPRKIAMLDFNVGYFVTTILAFVFLALGALIQYGTGTAIKGASAAYITQFIKMYSSVIGNWSGLLIAFIAFMCIFGTTITVVDGYSRANAETLRLIRKQKEITTAHFNTWMIVTVILAMIIVFFFAGNVAAMMNFAMIFSFVSAPVYSYLNFSLVKDNSKLPVWLWFLSVAGIVYLAGFTIFFLVYLSGILR